VLPEVAVQVVAPVVVVVVALQTLLDRVAVLDY
jgi:hypothetical protein